MVPRRPPLRPRRPSSPDRPRRPAAPPARRPAPPRRHPEPLPQRPPPPRPPLPTHKEPAMALVADIKKTVTDTTPVYAAVGATDLAVEKVRHARVRHHRAVRREAAGPGGPARHRGHRAGPARTRARPQ